MCRFRSCDCCWACGHPALAAIALYATNAALTSAWDSCEAARSTNASGGDSPERSEGDSFFSADADEDADEGPSPDLSPVASPTRRVGERLGCSSAVNRVPAPRRFLTHSSLTMRLLNQHGPSPLTRVTGSPSFPAWRGTCTKLTGPRSAPLSTSFCASSFANRSGTPATRASSSKGQRHTPYSSQSCSTQRMSTHAPLDASEHRRSFALARQSPG
jgi:hypothetical protein